MAPARAPRPTSRSPRSSSPRSATDIELCYQTFGDPDGRAAAARDGSRRTDDLVGPRAVPDARRARLLRHPLRQPRHRPLLAGPRTGSPASTLVRAFAGPPGAAAVHPGRHGRRRASGCSTTSGSTSAHVVGVSMGGMIAQTMAITRARAGALADQHHVDHRQAVGRLAAPAAAPPMLIAPRTRPGGVRRDQRRPVWKLIGSPAYPQAARRGRRRAPRETFDRGVSRQRRAAPDAGDPDRSPTAAARLRGLRDARRW